MNKKVLSVLLALILMIPNFAFGNDAGPSLLKDELGGNVAQESNENATVSNTRALQALMYQANGKLQEKDSVEVIVSFKPEAFQNLGEVVPASKLYQGDNVSRQQSLGEEIVEEGLRRIENEIGNVSTIFEYHVLFFGFSAELTFEQAKTIAQLDYVDFVEIATQRSKPTLKNPLTVMTKNANEIKLRSALRDPFDVREIVGSPGIYENNKGEGTLIAIIDSGYDVNHKSFYLSESDSAKLSKAEVNALISAGTLKGHYVKDKIPFAYNYRDSNNRMKEASFSSHGQHVAGIAAGNAVKYKSGDKDAVFSGIAPEAQLALMRVFTDSSPTTSSVFYAKALDDAAILKADSANMSLGAPAGDYRSMDKHTIDALKRLKEAGCVVAIAAGNETAVGDELGILPDAANPDYGILGTPAIEENSLAVASLQNDVVVEPFFRVLPTKDAAKGETYSIRWQGTLAKFNDKEVYEYIFVGLGKPDDVKNVDLTGKYALIERGDIPFSEKVQNAVNKGAVGVIIFNSASGGETSFGMAGVEKATVPVAAVVRSVGLKLKEKQQFLKFSKGLGTFESKTAGYISAFSSFGLTADGDFKPDITAPGGNIFSLANDQDFINNSGTSMASPQVAGGIALVRKRVAKDFPQLSQAEQWQLVRNLLMSTAQVHYNKDTKAASTPRQQGAGIMWLDGAINSNVVLIGDKGESKILRPNASDKEMLSFVVKNYSNEEKTFSYYAVAVTDDVENGKFTLRPHDLGLDLPTGEVTVPANGEATVQLMLDSSSKTAELKAKMPNGYFVDGFVLLEGDEEDLSIPFVTFVGKERGLEGVDYVEAPVYDLIKAGRYPFYYKPDVNSHWKPQRNLDYTHLFVQVGAHSEILGAVHGFDFADPKFEDKLVISPNGDNMADDINMLYVMLRNGSTQVDVYPLDQDGNRVVSGVENMQRKIDKVKNYGTANPNQLNSNFAGTWPKEASKRPKDGNYVAVIQSWGTKGESQKAKDIEIPFIVDTVKPSAKNGRYFEITRLLKFEPTDNVGVKRVEVSYGKDADKKIIRYDRITKGYKIPEGVALKDVNVVIWDLGYNKSEFNGETAKDIDYIGSVTVNLDWQSKPDAYKPKYVIKSQDPTDTRTYDENFLPFGKYVLEFKRPFDHKNYTFFDEENFDPKDNMYRYKFEVTKEKPEAVVTIKLARIYRVEVDVRGYKAPGQNLDSYKKIYQNIESVKVVSSNDYTETDLKFGFDSILGEYIGYNKEFLHGEYDVIVNLKEGSPNYKMRLYQKVVFLGEEFNLELGEYDFKYPIKINHSSLLSKSGNIKYNIELFESDVDKKELTELVHKADWVESTDGFKNATEEQKKAYQDAISAGIRVLWNRNATQADVDKAVKAIKDAEKPFGLIAPPAPVDKRALAKAIQKAKDAKKTDRYNAASQDLKDALDQALKNAEALLKKKDATEQEVKDAIQAIENAIRAIGIVDFTKLDRKVEEAEKAREGYQYKVADPELQKALDEAIAAAKELKTQNATTIEQVEEAIKRIDNALEAIRVAVPLPDVDKLEKIVKEAEEFKEDYQYKNADRNKKNRFDIALRNGQNLLEKFKKGEKVTANQVTAAINRINSAMNLIKKGIESQPNLDLSKLEEALKNAKAVQKNPQYNRATPKQKLALEEAVKEGENLIAKIKAKGKTNQKEVDKAAKMIMDAIEAIGMIDTANLEKAINDAKAAKSTPRFNLAQQEAKDLIEKVIADAEALLKKEDVTLQEVEDATKQIKIALAAFELLPEAVPAEKAYLKRWVNDAARVRETENYKESEKANQKRYEYAIEKGLQILEDDAATQQEVDSQVKEIESSFIDLGFDEKDKLPVPPNTALLELLVKQAPKVKESDSYVHASEQALRDAYDQAVKAAEDLLAKIDNRQDVAQDEVEASAKAILSAIIKLNGEPK